jgi:hypothetical protein
MSESNEYDFDNDRDTLIQANEESGPLLVTINRKRVVAGFMVGVLIAGSVVLGLFIAGFGRGPVGNINTLMSLLFGFTVFIACLALALWIRGRWICVGVIDEEGVIANTLGQKYQLTWSDLVGARTYFKKSKQSNKPQLRILLLLEEERCLEANVEVHQFSTLVQILSNAAFKPGSQGQCLGTLKGLAVIFFGILTFILGVWWASQVIEQFNRGVLFKGNGRVMMIKVLLAVGGPGGGIAAAFWGFYHLIARPILYPPGWIAKHEIESD